MATSHDPELLARIFNEYGDQEWNRHEKTPASRVSFHIHRTYLTRFVKEGDRVLDAGAGSGRYTVELARLGASVTALDLSSEQLRINRMHVEEAEVQNFVEAWEVGDIVDLSRYADDSFDAIACYGGPLSYALDRAADAVAEMVRVTRPGGHILVSVMSHFGTLRALLPGVNDDMRAFGLAAMKAIVDSGDLPLEYSSTAPMHLFTWQELKSLFETQPCRIVATSAANFLSLQNDAIAEQWLADQEMSQVLLDWELRACADPAVLDAGTHILAVVERLQANS